MDSWKWLISKITTKAASVIKKTATQLRKIIFRNVSLARFSKLTTIQSVKDRARGWKWSVSMSKEVKTINQNSKNLHSWTKSFKKKRTKMSQGLRYSLLSRPKSSQTAQLFKLIFQKWIRKPKRLSKLIPREKAHINTNNYHSHQSYLNSS